MHLIRGISALLFAATAVVYAANTPLYASSTITYDTCSTSSISSSTGTTVTVPKTTLCSLCSTETQAVYPQSVSTPPVTQTITRVLEQFCSTGIENRTVTATITVTTTPAAGDTPVVPQGFVVTPAYCGAECGYKTPVSTTLTICTACGVTAAVVTPAALPKEIQPASAAATPPTTTYQYNPSIPPSPIVVSPSSADKPVAGQGFIVTDTDTPSTTAAPAQPTTLQKVAANSVSVATGPTFTGGATALLAKDGNVGVSCNRVVLFAVAAVVLLMGR